MSEGLADLARATRTFVGLIDEAQWSFLESSHSDLTQALRSLGSTTDDRILSDVNRLITGRSLAEQVALEEIMDERQWRIFERLVCACQSIEAEVHKIHRRRLFMMFAGLWALGLLVVLAGYGLGPAGVVAGTLAAFMACAIATRRYIPTQDQVEIASFDDGKWVWRALAVNVVAWGSLGTSGALIATAGWPWWTMPIAATVLGAARFIVLLWI